MIDLKTLNPKDAPSWARNTTKAAKNGGAVMYTHYPLRFKLLIPISLQREAKLQIGNVTLDLHYHSRGITGDVPASWLVDLSGDLPDDGDCADLC